LPPAQGIKPNHIIVHRKTTKFFHCTNIESRSSVLGIRNYYYCRSYRRLDDISWLMEEDIRPVREEEGDTAIGWLMASRIAGCIESESEPENPAECEIPQPDRPKAIDLFSGAGGFTLGLAGAGFDVVGHVEWDKHALATYELNAPGCGFGNSELICRDITKITDKEILVFKKKHDHIHLIVGGPPCQGFSTSGKRDPKDPRNSLFIHFMRFVKLMQPDTFVMENVPGMKSMKTARGENCLEIILKAFRELGYTVDWRILNAVNYMVPQSRRRIFIMGHPNGRIPMFPLPINYGEDEGK